MDTEGSGLGLFISKNIIEAHKGEIGFDSKEGEGSVFFFILPVVG
jgi:signal transduction histidine kinase